MERFLWALALFTGEVLRSGRNVVGAAPLGFYSHVMDMPFITPDTQEYRELEQAGLLVTDRDGKSYISHWWNGWSAVLDMTQPAACSWLKRQLDGLQAMGVDGFKFDAGTAFTIRRTVLSRAIRTVRLGLPLVRDTR